MKSHPSSRGRGERGTDNNRISRERTSPRYMLPAVCGPPAAARSRQVSPPSWKLPHRSPCWQRLAEWCCVAVNTTPGHRRQVRRARGRPTTQPVPRLLERPRLTAPRDPETHSPPRRASLRGDARCLFIHAESPQNPLCCAGPLTKEVRRRPRLFGDPAQQAAFPRLEPTLSSVVGLLHSGQPMAA